MREERERKRKKEGYAQKRYLKLTGAIVKGKPEREREKREMHNKQDILKLTGAIVRVNPRERK